MKINKKEGTISFILKKEDIFRLKFSNNINILIDKSKYFIKPNQK